MIMMRALTNARIFDGFAWHDESALLIDGGKIADVVVMTDISSGLEQVDTDGAIIVPGFIDLQVNGGGGVMLNDDQSVEGIRQICAAHAKFGTTSLLPTLITDTREITVAAIKAGLEAKDAGVPGFLGLHLEGPHLSVARKGTHHPGLIRPMEDIDLQNLLAIGHSFNALMITVAPENTTEDQVRALADGGFIVSLGHTNASYETAMAYAKAGARTITHLFNAMSPLENRTPGLVGAALDMGNFSAGIITDGYHVHPASLGAALRAKRGPGRIFIVTDAMSTIGTDLTGLTLNGRQIYRKDGRLTLADGTLAGADIDMLSSVLFVHRKLDVDFGEAVRMASLYPAEAAGVADHKGKLAPGHDADFVILDSDYEIKSTWIGGEEVFKA
ncbi:N-acetylglucosamine-6-phosphate deacetylase [Agrobacterium rosae]|uniref:N-acetylglucosamine-6-phosphate deacetylase n=1 Tax=Agrobacterium rosae TaxID=1972867 RepID=UPI000CD90F94|nr:N-acetylglucosamine-6-phosphate deacetylase [Agrobacterium rosae]POO55313.1 N-acetylglucosamine-6-phosphate deacetylase [Agrobacterium rosae]